jgi:hypothetical protein
LVRGGRPQFRPAHDRYVENNAPGITEGDAVSIARSRLQIRGLAPTEGIRPRVERVALTNDAVAFWQVSFLVAR